MPWSVEGLSCHNLPQRRLTAVSPEPSEFRVSTEMTSILANRTRCSSLRSFAEARAATIQHVPVP